MLLFQVGADWLPSFNGIKVYTTRYSLHHNFVPLLKLLVGEAQGKSMSLKNLLKLFL